MVHDMAFSLMGQAEAAALAAHRGMVSSESSPDDDAGAAALAFTLAAKFAGAHAVLAAIDTE